MTDKGNSSTITITLNGEERGVPGGMTLSDLLAHLELNEALVVIERNREIVRRERYRDVAVSAGDTIELVHFVGGG